MELQGAVAIVTGASKGIGRAIAVALAEKDVHVVLAARSADLLTSVEQEIISSKRSAFAVPTDITSEQSVHNLIAKTKERFGRIDILINNAGVGKFGSVADMKTEDYQMMMDVNLKGVFFCSRAVLPMMIQQQHGEVINIASLAGKNSFSGGSVYSATKWGLIGFSRSLMLEVRDHNIRVVTLCPGSVNTGFGDKESDNTLIIQPEDIAGTVLFALSMPNRVNVSEIDIRPTKIPKK